MPGTRQPAATPNRADGTAEGTLHPVKPLSSCAFYSLISANAQDMRDNHRGFAAPCHEAGGEGPAERKDGMTRIATRVAKRAAERAAKQVAKRAGCGRGWTAGLVLLAAIAPAAAQNAADADTANPDTAAFLREILAAVEGGENAATLDAGVATRVEEAGAAAAAAIAANDADAAIAALEGAIEAVSDARPFGVRRAVLVSDEVETFGDYDERPDNAYAPQETVTLYVEPTGYDFAGTEGAYTVELSGDYALLSPSEQILLVGQADFARFDFEAETKTQDLFLTISYTLRDLRPGTYTIVTRLNDLNGGDATSFRTPITIGEASEETSEEVSEETSGDAAPEAPSEMTDTAPVAPAGTAGETTAN